MQKQQSFLPQAGLKRLSGNTAWMVFNERNAGSDILRGDFKFLIPFALGSSQQEVGGTLVFNIGFSLFLFGCALFGWGFAAALNSPAMAFATSTDNDR